MMSQYDNAKPYWMELEDQSPRTSALAIAALICGLGGVLICLPFLLPVAGLILGAAALATMAASTRPLRGRGIAVLGLIVSLVFLMVHVYAAMYVHRLLQQPAQGTRAFITALEQGDITEARRLLTQQASGQVTDEEIADLARRLPGTYGSLLDVKIDWAGNALTHPLPDGGRLIGFDSGGDFPPLPIEMRFTDGSIKAAVKASRAGRFAVGDMPVRLNWLAFVEPDEGVQIFPTASTPRSIAMALNNTSWYICRDLGRSEQEYRHALALAERACAIEPNGTYLNTLGVAQYRLGMYQEAFETLTRADELNQGIPEDVVFLAMLHHRFGDEDAAEEQMQRLRRIMARGRRGVASEMRMFIQEAEQLLAE